MDACLTGYHGQTADGEGVRIVNGAISWFCKGPEGFRPTEGRRYREIGLIFSRLTAYDQVAYADAKKEEVP